ncbi:FAD-dependent oxidoreductase [Amycolatopsis mediterranei S699]|uniref:FAD-dependent oxidoreductase n=2 Tax=Amycolatopsis mediterranei TaxID=33910 RepID=A0A0H3DA33_AMYMU|nr:FAD-dependent monooxygenase [Amycolatopsis mediterranei]ADJ46938.1 FAD-dependent oxidoreductase [Amycolatopsis mediterranei U32]AEK43750.1 FAD-dependent oxidoreductase [Amycolatopsis mediterranei S699]AFO78650.1 FAD-dependent oxidoreductase [Amycolatopsis mediterranei S699]AGT85778.1 FAD-dependent oxidoreductase [Amycolatopsis mediterranei RB]KDO04626.1 FAD-dependent oxidoreductase [Amycolatopsis mediterranei]
MKNPTVLISGASIAGPALACLLTRYGCTVTIVERAPALRPGGQAVDFKGATHRTVLERMGILDDVLARQTGGQDQTIVDATGRARAVIPGEFTGGDVEIRRGDLAEILSAHSGCEYLFGDTITSLTETTDGVDVTFAHAEPRRFDLVVGADGIHSNVRRLAFGPERDYVRYLGYHYALAELGEDIADGEAVMYNEPGRMAAVGGPKASAFFVFASPELDYDRTDTEKQRQLLMDAYRGGGWRLPELMAKIPRAGEFYLDSLSRVTIDRYSRGRVVLLGDAAYGNTLGGFGTGLAVVGAYVLAGELLEAGGDHRVAFARYEELMRDYAKVSQRGSAGPFLAPPSRLRITLRDWTFKSRFLLGLMLKATDKFATDIELPGYASGS